MRARRILALLPFAGGLTGCDLFTADIEEPSICQNFPDQAFVGVQSIPGIPLPAVHQRFTQDLSSVPSETGSATKVEARVVGVDLTAKSGIDDLSFIDAAQVTVLPPRGTNLPPVQVINYRANGNPGRTLHLVPSDTSQNLFDYLKGKQVTFDAVLAVNGLPARAWTMDVKACLYVKASVKYFETKPPGG